MKLIVFFLAAAAAAATGGSSRLALGGVERVGHRVWETSTGVTVICGGRRRPSDRPAPSVELQLSAVLDSICRYLDNGTGKEASAVGELSSIQQPKQDDVVAADSYDSVRYKTQRDTTTMTVMIMMIMTTTTTTTTTITRRRS